MTHAPEQSRPEPPVAGDETATLLGSLDRQRATLAWKCGGLEAAGMRATVGASTITLGGLLKHLALIEDHTFSAKLLGRDLGPRWNTADWVADPDWEWHSAADDSPEELLALWQAAVARSRALVRGGTAQRRPRTAVPASVAGRYRAKHAAPPDRPYRGVRAPCRPCRSHPRVGGRARRGGSARLIAGNYEVSA
jgi:hypothetical protein